MHRMKTKELIDELNNLIKRLERLRPVNMMKEHADLVESTSNILKQTPLGIYVI